jgi:thiol-disulfide isomerase/thioredoxin
MKEIIHFSKSNSSICESMIPVIDKFVSKNPEIGYTKIDVDSDPKLYAFYSKGLELETLPAFFGIVDGKTYDSHLGYASVFILESLIN